MKNVRFKSFVIGLHKYSVFVSIQPYFVTIFNFLGKKILIFFAFENLKPNLKESLKCLI